MASEDKKANYIVYDHKDWPRFVGTARECAAYMGVTESSFWSALTHTRYGRRKGRAGYYKVYKVEEGEEA